MQMVRFALLVCIALYAFIVKMLPSTGTPNLLVFRVMLLLVVVLVGTLFAFRRMMVKPAELALANQPDDPSAIARWRMGYLITYVLSEAIATYGVMLHFMGFTLVQVAPFFVAGFVLIVFYSPRIPAPAQ